MVYYRMKGLRYYPLKKSQLGTLYPSPCQNQFWHFTRVKPKGREIGREVDSREEGGGFHES